jgi:PhnB protein
MPVQPYLFFEGRCQEAIDFYTDALGATTLMRMTYGESPVPTSQPPENADRIMHATIRVGDGEILLSDGHMAHPAAFQGFGLTLTAADDNEARRFFTRLAEHGTISMPLSETFFASAFGMVIDRFGVLWMIMVPRPEAGV